MLILGFVYYWGAILRGWNKPLALLHVVANVNKIATISSLPHILLLEYTLHGYSFSSSMALGAARQGIEHYLSLCSPNILYLWLRKEYSIFIPHIPYTLTFLQDGSLLLGVWVYVTWICSRGQRPVFFISTGSMSSSQQRLPVNSRCVNCNSMNQTL